MSERLNLTGQKKGAWSVGKLIIGKDNKSYFECECICGTKRIVKGTALKSGASKSCGCMSHNKEAIEKRKNTMKKEQKMIEHTAISLIKNICNGSLMKSNKSGCTGVIQKGNSWTAEIRCQGEYHYLGSYHTYDEAVIARKNGEKQYFGKILEKIQHA